MSKLKAMSFALLFALPFICIASTIYEDARSYAISLYEKGQYQEAASQFVAAQNIAPINNDITLWLSKCNRNIALQNNKKRVSPRISTTSRSSKKRITTKQNSQQDEFVVYDSIGR